MESPLPLFKLEEYFSRYEFNAPYLLCCSDAETVQMKELLELSNYDKEISQWWNDLSLGYTEIPGHPTLRATIAAQLYPNLNKINILTFAGAEEAIYCALRSICQPSDHVIVITPCYQSLLDIPKSTGCEITSIQLQESNDWELNISDIATNIRDNTKVLIINFPHNPTGQIISTNKLKELIDLIESHKIWLFSDEVYLGLEECSESTSQLFHEKSAVNLYSRAISLGVMSKSFGLAGLRIGWIACQDTEMLHKISQYKHYTTICSSAPSEVLAVMALNNMQTIIGRNNEIIQHNLQLLDAFFLEYSHLFSWVRPRGGCTGFALYHGVHSIEEFCQRVVDQVGVLLLPGTVYNVTTKHFRIGFGRRNMSESLEKLKLYLQANSKNP